MPTVLGIETADGISAGVVENNRLASEITGDPERSDLDDVLTVLPAEGVAKRICEVALQTLNGRTVDAIGVGFPGIVRHNIVEESPNVPQMKGFHLGDAIRAEMRLHGVDVPVTISNDADVVAAGIAAARNQLDRLIRVWTLGVGIGYGRYPSLPGVWEGGHIVVTLDPKEKFCGCGGVGHLEGIMGYRSMRLRFLDLEPEEIFEQANEGDSRCVEFVRLWHRALAAATANSIHLDGPGKFYITGPSANYLNLGMLNQYMHEMVKMSSLQGYVFEIVPGGQEIAIIGAAVNAVRVHGAGA
jgi:predicted NBD/HSP70 family sugar kinase